MKPYKISEEVRLEILAMKVSLVTIASTLVLLQAAPAFADDFADGCTLYGIKHYKNAELSFKKALAVNPASAPTHYYLGMCYMNTGKTAQAKQEFQTCLNLRPDPTTTQYCQSLLTRLSGAAPAGAVRAAAPTAAGASGARSSGLTSSASPAPSSSSAPAIAGGNAHDIEVEKRRKQIMDKANQEIAEIRAEYAERLEKGMITGKATHIYYKEDGTAIVDMDPETRAAIRKEGEDKVEKIREMAEYQCKFVK